MWLVCTECKKQILIAKRFSDWYCFHENFNEKLDKFFDEHDCCGDSQSFKLEYENVTEEEKQKEKV